MSSTTVTVVIYYEESVKSASDEQAGHPESMEPGANQTALPHSRPYPHHPTPMHSAKVCTWDEMAHIYAHTHTSHLVPCHTIYGQPTLGYIPGRIHTYIHAYISSTRCQTSHRNKVQPDSTKKKIMNQKTKTRIAQLHASNGKKNPISTHTHPVVPIPEYSEEYQVKAQKENPHLTSPSLDSPPDYSPHHSQYWQPYAAPCSSAAEEEEEDWTSPPSQSSDRGASSSSPAPCT